MATMRAVQISKQGGDFELVERDVPDPGPREVRISVEACGVCHSDDFVKQGTFPGIRYPRVPGHEVIGRVEAIGRDVEGYERDQRVGVGWHGGHCFGCEACREGDFLMCSNAQITGITRDGGFAEKMVAREEAVARVPEELSSEEAAPLMCAGVTVYNGMRHTGARPGDVIAVQGIGGLGHLALQYARRSGFRTVAISHGPDKESLARELGAHEFVDSSSTDPAEALQDLGGARVVIATAPHPDAIGHVLGGLGRNGELLAVAATGEPIQVPTLALIPGRRAVRGWPSGTAKDSEQTLSFSALAGTRTMVETFPLEQADKGYRRMMDNEVRFRTVLQP